MLALERVTVGIETYGDVIDEIKPLLKMHWEEIASFKKEIPLDPDYSKYAEMEACGRLFIIAGRVDGALIGYSITILLNNPHYKSTLVAMNDVVYVHPDHRRGSFALRLIRETERRAKRAGAVKMSWHYKPLHPGLGQLLAAMNYIDDEITKARLL